MKFKWQRVGGLLKTHSDRRNSDRESGEATVEFIGMAVILIIPVAYFIITIAAIQAAVFASEAAAREAGRILANNPDSATHVSRQVDQIFTDYPVNGTHNLEVVCQPQPCANAKTVHVQVSTKVQLPLIPNAFQSVLVPSVPISADYVVPVSAVRLVE